jgi:hypothetical protein
MKEAVNVACQILKFLYGHKGFLSVFEMLARAVLFGAKPA